MSLKVLKGDYINIGLNQKNNPIRVNFFGAAEGARTLTSLLIRDFESLVSTISPPRLPCRYPQLQGSFNCNSELKFKGGLTGDLSNKLIFFLVQLTGLEPAHSELLYHLKVACLPFHHNCITCFILL
jgi:hypothetical protein